MGQTANFGIPYQARTDTPDGPIMGEALAESIDVLLSRALPVANAAARLAISGSALYEGLIVAQRDDFSGWIYLVGNWRQVWAGTLGGSTGGTTSATGGGTSLDIASYRATSPQTFANSGVEYPIAFGNAPVDSSSVTITTKGQGHQFHAVAGVYLVDTTVRFAAGPAGSRFIALRTIDDVTQFATAQNDGGPGAATRTFAKVIALASAADLYLVASQSSGGALATQATSAQNPSGYVTATFTRIG